MLILELPKVGSGGNIAVIVVNIVLLKSNHLLESIYLDAKESNKVLLALDK